MKRILLILLVLIILSSCTNTKSDPSITDIHVLAFNSEVVLTEGSESEEMYFTVEYNDEFDINDISFISKDDNIATAEYKETLGKNCVFYTIKAKCEGVTTLYFSANDGSIRSEDITVTVTRKNEVNIKDEAYDANETQDALQVFGDIGSDAESPDNASSLVTSSECTYVLNKSSKKFHDKNCSSVATIKSKNYGEHFGTRKEVVSLGYEPCGNCKP